MNEEILKFIKNEKEIARYKLSLLHASKKSAYKNRLIAKEEEYIDFPFESLEFASINDVRRSLTLFKVDRPTFDKKFSIKKAEGVASTSQINTIKSRASELRGDYSRLISQEIYSKVIDEYSAHITGKKSGAIFEKAKARIKVMICCLARHFFTEANKIDSKITKNMSRDDFLKLKEQADSAYDRSALELFRFYNESIEQTYRLMGDGGDHSFILSVYPVSNLFDKFNKNSYKIKRILKNDKRFFSKTGRPISKKSTERGWGLITPINRVGNETTDVLYRNIYSESGVCLDKIMNNNFHNTKDGQEYYKAISTLPAWTIISMSLERDLELEVCKLFGSEKEPLCVSSLSNKDLVNAINFSDNSINIDLNRSKILIAATRSEADKINEAKKYIELLIKELKEEYNCKFYIQNDSPDKRESRKEKIKGIIGSITK